MKKNSIFFVVAALLLSCTQRPKNETSWQPVAEGVTARTIDSIRVITLQDNIGAKAMPNKLFYGTADSALVEKLSPQGTVPSSIHAFLLQSGGHNILFDTGNGPAANGQLAARLYSAGIAPQDIDMLVLTHFHGDHIGGMLQNDTALFANAEVYVPEKEYDFWVTNGNPDGQQAHTMAVYASRLHRFLPHETLPCGIQPIAAYGHTPGHTAFRIGRLLVIGDVIHGAALQLAQPDICAQYDMNREEAIATRKKLLEYIRQENLIVAGMHLPANGILEPETEDLRQ